MALEMDVVSSSGIPVKNAYVAVVEYNCDKDEYINAKVAAYVSKEFKEEGKTFIDGTSDIITIKGDYRDESMNTKKQIYAHMKTLEKYEDAIDA